MTDMNGLVNRYLAIWNEPDADSRAKAVAELWTEDGTYLDPLADVQGHAAIDAVIAGARAQFPGYVFVLSAGPDAHHDVARFSWELVPEAGGESLVAGSDLAVGTEDGRLRNVYGFLDKVPPTS